jgi:AcrR family transcriptional regulator
MNKRAQSKEKTRSRLLKAAKEEFLQNGFLKSKTEDIAKRAGVAHGTLFLHFESKDNLILEIYDSELKKVTNELYQQLDQVSSVATLLDIYLDWLEENETFYAIIAKELPYYPGKLRRKIMPRDAAIRSYFYAVLERGIEMGCIKQMDITMAITFLFGTVNFLLSLKPAFTNQGSVIQAKKEEIKRTFLTFITT